MRRRRGGDKGARRIRRRRRGRSMGRAAWRSGSGRERLEASPSGWGGTARGDWIQRPTTGSGPALERRRKKRRLGPDERGRWPLVAKRKELSEVHARSGYAREGDGESA